ncbi:unnamed protein product [Vitrella brassicaformis CCMP3155]|uniref:CBM20 domain-containing protein n=1 Tax=Vitrella brassicaformis (strain CCMP3155) TaxID=1169540 RepID=A0A0G4H0E3_VITBC|nr:unnamed protein product [Vitrella brassicaformis CCMP3155]|eukprot:CEM37015.1 unnamed protein product [Vitrella brassicaformis CCMP3155]
MPQTLPARSRIKQLLLPAGGRLEYKYSICKGDGSDMWEPFTGNHDVMSLPKGHFMKLTNSVDRIRSFSCYRIRPLRTSRFEDLKLRHFSGRLQRSSLKLKWPYWTPTPAHT